MDRYVERAVLDMLSARDELLAAIAELGADDWRRYVPYGSRTLAGLLDHVAAADHTWALAAQGLLKGEGEPAPTLRRRTTSRGGQRPPDELLEEMSSRRRLLLGLYELLEPRHLALALPAFGKEHNSVRERIWRGYHDRMHAADIRRALRMTWHPQRLAWLPQIQPAVEALSPDPALYVIYSVDPVNWERPSSLPGWTYRQLLAHIATGDWVFQAFLQHVIERSEIPPWPDVAAGNERLLAERASTTHRALTEELLSMRHGTLRLLSELRPEHLALPMEFWWEPKPNSHTLLDYVLMFHRHEKAHAEQLRPAMAYAR